jgi:hypothetical protein
MDATSGEEIPSSASGEALRTRRSVRVLRMFRFAFPTTSNESGNGKQNQRESRLGLYGRNQR